MVCSKVLFIKDEIEFDNFKTWVYFNKLLGYEKIVIHSLPGFEADFKPYESYFEQNKDFIELRRLKCIPNLVADLMSNESKYLHNYYDKNVKNRKNRLYRSIECISYVLINECYMDNFDKYKYYI